MKKIFLCIVLLNSYFFSVAQLTVNIPKQILDCNTPSVVLTASTPSSNVFYMWSYPGGTTQQGPTITVIANISMPTSTLIGNYTLTATDIFMPSNVTKTVIAMYQNLFRPKAMITKSANAITCATPSVLLTNQSSSTIPPNFPSAQPVVGFEWHGPSPQQSLSMSTNYVGHVPGNYTLIAKDLNNGCTSSTTTIVEDNQDYPILNNPTAPPPYSLCNVQTVTLTPNITSIITNLTFTWTSPSTATVSGVNTINLTTNTAGIYTITAKDSKTGCASSATMQVITCVDINENEFTLGIQIYPNPAKDLIHFENYTAGLIDIYDVNGRLVLEGLQMNDDKLLDVSAIKCGVYFLTLKSNSEIMRVKFVKE